MTRSFFLAAMFCLFPAFLHAQTAQSILKQFQGVFEPVLKKHYPEASVVVFESRLYVEHNTRLFVDELVAKTPLGVKAPVGLERGPKAGGLYGHIDCKTDASNLPAPVRGEGTFKRKHFAETIHFHTSKKRDARFDLMMRLPDDGEKSKAFVKAVKRALKAFDKVDDL